jgi:MFS family permease
MRSDPQIIAARFVRRLALFYAALFVSIGIQLPFFPLWLEAKGLDAKLIGIVLAAPMVVRIAAIPLATRAADRRDALRGAMIAGVAATALGFALVGLSEGAGMILFIYALTSIAMTPILPLADAYALKGLAGTGTSYGSVRLWGSVAFIVGSLAAGLLLDLFPPIRLIWFMAAAAAKLVDILKVLLCYSNNFMAERLGDSMGGVQAVRYQLIETLGLAPDQLQMSSLSGLGVNRASPRTMMKIFRALREELRKHRLSTTDIMSVAGIDPGTMETRFDQTPYRGSVIAKTGTLIRTDGGASSLVGQMKTAKGTLLFVIMNRRGNVSRFRSNQDYLVMQIQSSRGGPSPFSYKPHLLTMKLADTQSSFATANEEFEPGLKLSTAPR